MEKQTLRVLVKEPYKEPYVKEIDKNLETYQNIVGGTIDCISMPNMDNVDITFNDEGMLIGMFGNFWLPEYEDCVKGPCFISGYNPETGDTLDLTDEQIELCKKYIELYKIPNEMDLYADYEELSQMMKQKYKAQCKKVAVM